MRKQTSAKMLNLYGIGIIGFARLWVEQKGCCAICEQPFPDETSAQIDHDHVTDTVRGLLCKRCNTGIGKLGDTEAGLQRALNYIRKANAKCNTFPD